MAHYDERLKRTMNAIFMKPVDKIPFSFNGPAYIAHRQGVKLADFLKDYDLAAQASIEFCNDHPGIDSIHTPIMPIYSLSLLWLAKVKVPGIDLPDDELWQLDEQENIKFEDYEKILEEGYGPWVDKFMKEKLGDPVSSMEDFGRNYLRIKNYVAKEADRPVMNDANQGTAFEGLCGGRQLMNFFMDIMDEPELVKKVVDNANSYIYKDWCDMLDNTKPSGVWVGGWRAAPAMLSHETWMEFVWPYLKRMILACTDRGVIPILHFDSNWGSELETLKELPPKKCLLMLDGDTDMRKAREVLDDRMCLMGDVPSRMLAFSSADAVYDYVIKLIDDVGPKTGLIVSSGCDCPFNAKDENVDAMIQATIDYAA